MAKLNPFLFSTKYQDDETAILYYGYRDYSPTSGRWLSRDPVEESGGENLSIFCGNDSTDHCDLVGERWTVNRNGSAKATAEPEFGDTVTDLANLVGLRASEYRMWLNLGTATLMPGGPDQSMSGCEHFEIPNTVLSYWAGWGAGVGKTYVKWRPSLAYLLARGFYVDARDHQKGSKLGLQKILISKSINKEVHGLYFWGHGYAPYPSTGLVSQSGDALLMYAPPACPTT
jgi:RHS repeat-associated protein